MVWEILYFLCYWQHYVKMIFKNLSVFLIGKVLTVSRNWKISFRIWRLIKTLKTLNIFNYLIFWWCAEAEPSLSRSSSEIDLLSLHTMRKHCLCNRFVLLFKERLHHIQIKGQYLNCDLKKAFIKIRFFIMSYMVPILQVHLTFLMLFGKCLQYAFWRFSL